MVQCGEGEENITLGGCRMTMCYLTLCNSDRGPHLVHTCNISARKTLSCTKLHSPNQILQATQMCSRSITKKSNGVHCVFVFVSVC